MPRQRSNFRNQTEYALLRALLATLRHSPQRLALARAAFALLDHALPRLRRVAERNLALAMPELDRTSRAAIIDGCWMSLARLLATLARFPDINVQNINQLIRYDGFENFEQARARGRGVLVATAHLGNWEFSAFAHALLSAPMAVVARPLDNPLLDELSTRYRTLSGNSVIGRGKDSIRPLLSALRANGAVGILIDQNVTPDRGAFINFFGQPACVDTGLARLAAHSGAAVIPGYAVWSQEESRYLLRFEPAVPITGDTLVDTQAVHARLEAAIRRWPAQWLWLHRRWKTRPPGEPSLYTGI